MEATETYPETEQIPNENADNTQANNNDQERQVNPTDQRDNPTVQPVNPTEEVNYPPAEQQANPTEEVNNPIVQQVNPTEELNNAVTTDNQNINTEAKDQKVEAHQEPPIENAEYPFQKEEGLKRCANSVYRTNALIVRNQEDEPEDLIPFSEAQSFIQNEIGEGWQLTLFLQHHNVPASFSYQVHRMVGAVLLECTTTRGVALVFHPVAYALGCALYK